MTSYKYVAFRQIWMLTWSSPPQATNLKPEKDDKNEDDTTSGIFTITVMIIITIMTNGHWWLGSWSQSQSWSWSLSRGWGSWWQKCQSHHLLQIRPIRADLDVQRFRQACEEKENHSEGERLKEKELKSTEERIKRKRIEYCTVRERRWQKRKGSIAKPKIFWQSGNKIKYIDKRKIVCLWLSVE